MWRIASLLITCLVVGCAMPGDSSSGEMRRLRFVPGSPPSSPMESSGSAVWTALHPFPEPDSETLLMHAWAGVGHKFPVGQPDAPPLFEVRLTGGDDDAVLLEILSDAAPQPITVERDVPVRTEVGEKTHEFTYQTIGVGSTEERTTTNKARLIVTTQR